MSYGSHDYDRAYAQVMNTFFTMQGGSSHTRPNHELHGVDTDNVGELVECILLYDNKYQKLRHIKRKPPKTVAWLKKRKHDVAIVVVDMWRAEQLVHFDGSWYLRVCHADDYRRETKKRKQRVKWDDHSFHGRPRRDRKRKPMCVSR